jgi:lipoate---protein ligase
VRQRPDSIEIDGIATYPLRAEAPAAVGARAGEPAEWLAADLESVEENLALDEALLEEAHEGLLTTSVVRTWMAKVPVVVVGSSSHVDTEVDRSACAALGVRIVRRPTGGASVVLGPGCLMWSVVTPYPQGTPIIEQLHASRLEPLCRMLSRTLPVSRGSIERRGSSDIVVVDAQVVRKFSGNALRVKRNGVLYHGTLLDNFNMDTVARLLRHPPREPDYRTRRSHLDFLTNLNLGQDVLEQVVRQAFAATVARSDWPQHRVENLVRQRYGQVHWTDRL